MTIERLQTNQRMSQAVKHGGVAYLAGQVPDDGAADIATQTQQVLDKIDGLLKAAGSDRTKLLSATIWLSDMRHFAEMNTVWDAWVPAGTAPARATVQAALARPDLKIEIGVIAAC
jgi:enamine deaminase RidA (YjgF/YER057c/UK114 family)